MNPIVVFIACHHEEERALRLAAWIRELGGVKDYDVLVCLNQRAAAQGLYDKLCPTLSDAFGSCALFVPHDEVEIRWGHPDWDASSANHMIKRVSQHCDWALHRPFLWIEMDAVPTRATWLYEIFSEYAICGKPFMGDKVDNSIHATHMSGIAVYPTDIATHSTKIRNCGKLAWDLASCDEVIPKAHFTSLIQHSYQTPGTSGCLTWRDGKLKSAAALFHQCKCGCLIEHLRGGGCSAGKLAEGVSSPAPLEIPAAPLAPTRLMHILDKPREPLTVPELIAALAEHAKKDKMAKGRIVRQLRVAGLIK